MLINSFANCSSRVNWLTTLPSVIGSIWWMIVWLGKKSRKLSLDSLLLLPRTWFAFGLIVLANTFKIFTGKKLFRFFIKGEELMSQQRRRNKFQLVKWNCKFDQESLLLFKVEVSHNIPRESIFYIHMCFQLHSIKCALWGCLSYEESIFIWFGDKFNVSRPFNPSEIHTIIVTTKFGDAIFNTFKRDMSIYV